MNVPIMIEWFIAAVLIITGVSHIVQPKLWADLFIDLLKLPYAGLAIGVLTLPLGLIVAIGHNIWTLDVGLIVTIVGWSWTIKGTLYLLFPRIPLKVAPRHMAHPERFAIAGAIIVLVGGIVVIRLIVAPPLVGG